MLRGELVNLRAIEPGDASTAWRWINDPEVTRFIQARYPMSLAAEQTWAEGRAKGNTYGNAAFAVEVASTGQYIGGTGLHDAKPEERAAELGIMIGEKEQWAHGYAFDAMRTLLCFGFRDMNLRRIWLRVVSEHSRAIALYERIGFTHEGCMRAAFYRRGQALDFLVMGMLREEFDARYGATEPVGQEARPELQEVRP